MFKMILKVHTNMKDLAAVEKILAVPQKIKQSYHMTQQFYS